MTEYAEGNYVGDVILNEEDIRYSREKVTVITGQVLTIGMVVGKLHTGVVSQDYTGTGDGVMTLDATTPALAGVQVGDYKVVCIEESADGGLFEVLDPQGNSLGQVAVGDTFANQIKFAIADGAEDFDVADIFVINVLPGFKVTQLAPAGTNGSELAVGFMVSDTDATAADVLGVAILREAIAKDTGLVWPAGITDAQKSTALAELERAGIITRTGV